jgi:hypothetical protein
VATGALEVLWTLWDVVEGGGDAVAQLRKNPAAMHHPSFVIFTCRPPDSRR